MKFSDDGTHLVGQIIVGNENVFTWATKPDASMYTGRAWISDIGVAGSLWYSDGTTWNHVAPIILHNTYYGLVFASMAAANAATYSQSGTTVTVTCTGHNIPASLHNGKSIYLVPGTPVTGSQLATGFYTNFTYVDANTFTCTSTVSQTGTGAINTNTSASPVGITIPIPGGLLGPNGWIDVYTLHQCNASAGTKRMPISYGSFSFKNISPISTTLTLQMINRMQNVNNTAKQVCFSTIVPAYTGASVGNPARGTEDTTVTQNITATCTLSSPLDYVSLDHLTITLYR